MMYKKTIHNLDLAAQRIADRLLELKREAGFVAHAKPYMNIKRFIRDNKKYFSKDMYGEVNLDNVCKTTRQLHYLSNEVLHRLRRGKFFAIPEVHKLVQMTFNFN